VKFNSIELTNNMKSITKLSLVLLTAMACAALPVNAQDSTTNAPATPRPRAARFGGTITAIDATAMTLTLKNRAGETTVKVTSTTKIKKDREPAVFADVKEGLRASGSGKKQDDGSWIANTLNVMTPPTRPPSAATPPAASTPPATTPPAAPPQ
jgi:hypothetical protein